jgi:adenylate cyclase
MSLFHKSVKERLAKHVAELKEFDLLPSDWEWHKDRVEALDKISNELIEDLMELHKEHKDKKESYKHMLPLAMALHTDLTQLMEQHGVADEVQESEAGLINRLLESLRGFVEN